jgi:hypothetical protein
VDLLHIILYRTGRNVVLLAVIAGLAAPLNFRSLRKQAPFQLPVPSAPVWLLPQG